MSRLETEVVITQVMKLSLLLQKKHTVLYPFVPISLQDLINVDLFKDGIFSRIYISTRCESISGKCLEIITSEIDKDNRPPLM